MSVTFKKDTHEYFNEKGKEYISVTSLVKMFTPTFDSDQSIVKRCAQREGISIKEMQARWEDIGKKAAKEGTAFHASAEHYIKTGEIKKDENQDLIIELSKIPFTGKLLSEQIVSSDKYQLAGTTDIQEIFPKNKLAIWDFKLVKRKPSGYEPYGNKMLPPIDHLYAASLVKFSLQLSLYGVILEESGLWLENLCVLWIDKINRKIEKFPLIYMRNDALKIIEYYNEITSW